MSDKELIADKAVADMTRGMKSLILNPDVDYEAVDPSLSAAESIKAVARANMAVLEASLA